VCPFFFFFIFIFFAYKKKKKMSGGFTLNESQIIEVKRMEKRINELKAQNRDLTTFFQEERIEELEPYCQCCYCQRGCNCYSGKWDCMVRRNRIGDDKINALQYSKMIEHVRECKRKGIRKVSNDSSYFVVIQHLIVVVVIIVWTATFLQ
jgi:hypothetical protein